MRPGKSCVGGVIDGRLVESGSGAAASWNSITEEEWIPLGRPAASGTFSCAIDTIGNWQLELLALSSYIAALHARFVRTCAAQVRQTALGRPAGAHRLAARTCRSHCTARTCCLLPQPVLS